MTRLRRRWDRVDLLLVPMLLGFGLSMILFLSPGSPLLPVAFLLWWVPFFAWVVLSARRDRSATGKAP